MTYFLKPANSVTNLSKASTCKGKSLQCQNDSDKSCF